MSYIYKITNITNNKQYIGYTSRDILTCFNEHWASRFSDKSILHSAMKKYGKNNFIIEMVEEVSDLNWEEKEQYYINYYNTLVPHGYNICIGGNRPPVHFGDTNIKTKITNAIINDLIIDLKNYELEFSQIASKYGISQNEVERINKGEFRRQENEDYPIRKMKRDHYIIKNIITDLQNNILTQEEIEEKYLIKSRTRLYNINNGKVGRKLFPQESYPIRVGIKNKIPDYLKKNL